MKHNDCRDWLVMFLVMCGGCIASVFLFLHPDPLNFATWATYHATAYGVFHWLTVRDAKTEDAP